MSHFKKRLQMLSVPAFRNFVLGCFFNAVGNGMGYIAMTWMVLRGSHPVSETAILMICVWAPGIVIGPIAGVIIDRFSRKWIIVAVTLMRAVLFTSFGLSLHYHFSVTKIYMLGLLSGSIFTVYGPTATRFIREIVDQKDLLYANSAIDMMYEVGNIIGMGIVGFVIAWFSGPIAIILNGCFFTVSTTLVLFISKKHIHEYEPEEKASFNLIADFKTGLRYMLDNKLLLVIYSVQLLILVQFFVAPVLLAPFVKSVLHADVSKFGEIEAAMSIGIVVGGIFMPWAAEKLGLIETIMVMLIGLGVCFLLFSFNRMITIAEVLYFVIGFAAAVWPLVLTKAQELTDVKFQGRVQATFNSLMCLIILIIYLFIKVSSSYISIPHLYWLEIVFVLFAVILLWFWGSK